MTSLALAGAGSMAAVHAMAAAVVPGARVTHVASRSRQSAERRAGELGAAAASYDDLPAGADVVVVCTPPSCHASQTLAALAAGAAVIVEKPLCRTLEEADAVVAAAAAGGLVGYAENLAFAPVVVQALGLLPSLGAVHHLEVRALQSRPTWGDFLTREWGGGALFDLGVHPLAVALLLAGGAQPVAVSAVLEGADDIETDEHAQLSLRFEDGLVAKVVSSWRAPAGDRQVWDFQAASTTGVLRGELLPVPALERNGDPVALRPLRFPQAAPQLEQYGYIEQLRSFLALFAAGRAPGIGAEFGRSVLDVVCAAYASAAADGAELPLPFEGPRDKTPLELWRP